VGGAPDGTADPTSAVGRARDVAHNRALWTLLNERFAADDADRAWREPDLVWGLFRTPDRDLSAIGEVGGLDVVELACGDAHVSGWLARHGARPVAVDLTAAQLTTARRCQQATGVWFPLVEADAETLPLVDRCCDLVVSEHGVAAWCDPARWVAEAARVLRRGGRLVFLTNSLLSALCVPAEGGVATERLLRGQRDTARIRWPGGGTEFHPSHGDWVRCLRANGFVVQALHELYAPTGSAGHDFYEIVSPAWAARWPAEELWVASLDG
jgi:SAM-dependent methyltransferase